MSIGRIYRGSLYNIATTYRSSSAEGCEAEETDKAWLQADGPVLSSSPLGSSF